jgi:ketosteroid isomerase-like protein
MVRAVYRDLNDTGEPSWDLFDPEAEFDATNVVGFGIVRGREQLIGMIREYTAAFDDWRIEPEEIRDTGQHVVAVVRDGGRVKNTDSDVYNHFVHVWTFRSGLILRWKTFTDRAEAFAAAGVRE